MELLQPSLARLPVGRKTELLALMFPLCDTPALVASGSSLALDIAVVDPPLAADLQAIEAYISAHHTGVKWHFVLNNHASTRPQKYGGPLVLAVTNCKTFQKNEA